MPSSNIPDFSGADDGPATVQETDDSLMRGIQSSHQASLQVLIERYWSPLTGYAAGIVGRADDAEDVVQETFVRVWRFRAEWQPSGTVAAYLYRITRNLALNALRDRQAKEKREERAGVSVFASAAADPLEEAEYGSLRDEVRAAIEALPERRREIFLLSRFHGLSHREIADALGISLPTVANQMSSALSTLRKTLAHHLSR